MLFVGEKTITPPPPSIFSLGIRAHCFVFSIEQAFRIPIPFLTLFHADVFFSQSYFFNISFILQQPSGYL
jgi:hypothetical protein